MSLEIGKCAKDPLDAAGLNFSQAGSGPKNGGVIIKAVVLREFGDPDVLCVDEVPIAQKGLDDILIRVRAAGVNRADLLERMGLYPPPDPQPRYHILGLECAGVVEQVGERVTRFHQGDRVMALVNGGAYAEYVACPADNAWLIPPALDDTQAAGIPEAFITAYDALVQKAELKMGQRVLIHAGAGGVGSAAIQLARQMGLHAAATVGSSEKAEHAKQFGAEIVINYRHEDFVREVLAWSDQGVDAVLDFVGQDYLKRNLAVLRTGGIVVVIGTLSGVKGELDLGDLLKRRLTVRGTALRSRQGYDKMRIIQEFATATSAFFQTGQLRAVIDQVFMLEEASQAHRYMASNKNIGKIILRMPPN